MTALELIKELEAIVPAIRPGNLVPKRWSPDGIVRSEPVLKDFEFLLRAFRVMREIAADANRLSGDDFGSRALAKGKFADDSEDEVDQEFEERMKQ